MQCHVFGKPLGASNGLNQRSTTASTFSLSVTRHAESRQINICGWYLATSPSEYRTRAGFTLPAPFYKVIFIFVELSWRIISQGGVRVEAVYFGIIFAGEVSLYFTYSICLNKFK